MWIDDYFPNTLYSLHERFFAFKQETTVAEYREKFEDYSAPLDNLDNATLEGKFVDGLKDDVKIKLRVARAVGLDMMMETAQKLEDELIHFEEKYFGASFSPKPTARSSSTAQSKFIFRNLNMTIVYPFIFRKKEKKSSHDIFCVLICYMPIYANWAY